MSTPERPALNAWEVREPPPPPLNRAWAEHLLAEAEAVGRDTALLRARMATYESRRLSGKPVKQAREWLESTVMDGSKDNPGVGKQSRQEKEALEAKIRRWAKADDDEVDRRRLKHYVRGAGRIRRSVAQGHTIHWQLGRYRRWVTLLGLETSSIPTTTTDESASSSLRVVPTAGN